MQITVQHVKPQIAGTRNSDDSIQVRAVAVNQAACVVDDLAHFLDILFEQAEGVGIRQHHANRLVVGESAQIVEVHIPARIRLDLNDFVAAH